MVKSTDEVVSDFNEIVNMTADELDEFLQTESSETTGYKEDGAGESIGHESGRKIVDILQRNPDKDPSKYTEEDKEHMRRVVSYAKRHLAQEGKLKESKTPEELEKTKSTRSLKNWGHDPLKTLSKSDQASAKESTSKSSKPASKKADKPKSSGKNDSAPAAAEKPKSKSKAEPEANEKAEKTEKPANKKETAAKEVEEAETGDKRAAEEKEKPAASDKPASKKAKTAKAPTEGTRKPPSRGAKKA